MLCGNATGGLGLLQGSVLTLRHCGFSHLEGVGARVRCVVLFASPPVAFYLVRGTHGRRLCPVSVAEHLTACSFFTLC